MEIFQMGKDHYVDIMEAEERKPAIDMAIEWEEQGHINLGHCVFDQTAPERNMGERKTCITNVFPPAVPSGSSEMHACFEFLAWIVINRGLERPELLEGKTAHFAHKKSHFHAILWLELIMSSTGTISSSRGSPCLGAVSVKGLPCLHAFCPVWWCRVDEAQDSEMLKLLLSSKATGCTWTA